MVSLTFGILLLTTALLLGLALLGWRNRTKQGALVFAILELLSALWASLTALGLTVPPGPLRVRLWGITSGLSLVVAVLWFGFIVSYTGRRNWLSVRRLGLLSVPLALGTAVYFVDPTWSPFVGQLSQKVLPAGTVVVAGIGPIGIALAAYLYLVFLLGLAFVGSTIIEGSRLFVGQALALLFGSLVPIVASFLAIVGITPPGYPITQVALGVQAVLWSYAVFGQELLQVVPAVAEVGEEVIFHNLNESLIVVDTDGNIVRANDSAQRQLGLEEPSGGSVASLLERMGASSLDALPTRFEYGQSTYRADSSQIDNWQGEPMGVALIIRDISELETREQRLSVLNRILRHNVRNDMNAVMGVGDLLKTRDDPALTEYGHRLTKVARDLSRVSDKAIEVDEMFAAAETTEMIDLPDLLDELVAGLSEEYPQARIETELQIEPIETDRGILRKVLEEVLANALEHGGEAPTVTVTATEEDAGVEVTIRDDGPGIPQSELQPVVAGEETDLEHTSSFGLWFIKWGIQSLGGEVSFESAGSGATVVLWLPETNGQKTTDSTPETPYIS